MLSERLHELRKIKNLTQNEAAEAMGIVSRTYGGYERGEREPDIKTMIKMADYFNCTLDYLVGRSFKPKYVVKVKVRKSKKR